MATAGVGTPDDPGLLRVYELGTGRLVGNVRVHGTLQDLDFSADGSLLASAGLDGDILVWDVRRRALARTIPHGVGILTIRFSPEGRTIATGDLSGNVDFWRASDGTHLGAPLGGHNGIVFSLSYDPSGTQLMTTSTDGKLRLWDLRSRKLVGSPLPGADVAGWGTFSADGRHAIAAFSDGTASSGTPTRNAGKHTPAAWPTATSRSGVARLRPRARLPRSLPLRSLGPVAPGSSRGAPGRRPPAG